MMTHFNNLVDTASVAIFNTVLIAIVLGLIVEAVSYFRTEKSERKTYGSKTTSAFLYVFGCVFAVIGRFLLDFGRDMQRSGYGLSGGTLPSVDDNDRAEVQIATETTFVSLDINADDVSKAALNDIARTHAVSIEIEIAAASAAATAERLRLEAEEAEEAAAAAAALERLQAELGTDGETLHVPAPESLTESSLELGATTHVQGEEADDEEDAETDARQTVESVTS